MTPEFKRWSLQSLRREAARLELPGWQSAARSYLIMWLIEAYS